MSAIFSFISTLYLKQQTNVLRFFSSLKFENSLFSNKLFRCTFRSERKIYTAANDQIRYFVQTRSYNSLRTMITPWFKTRLLKSHYFSLCKLLLDFATTTINYFSLSLWNLSKDFFTNQETACS